MSQSTAFTTMDMNKKSQIHQTHLLLFFLRSYIPPGVMVSRHQQLHDPTDWGHIARGAPDAPSSVTVKLQHSIHHTLLHLPGN